MDPEEYYMHNFSIIHRYSIMRHLANMNNTHISGHQMGYIIHIKKHPGASQEDIVDFFKLNKGTVAKGVKKLLDEGYIIRKQNEIDRRAYQLYLTLRGEQLFAESEKSIQEFNTILTRDLSDDECETFRRLLKKVTCNVLDAAGEAREELMRPGPPPGTPPCCHKDDAAASKQHVKKGD